MKTVKTYLIIIIVTFSLTCYCQEFKAFDQLKLADSSLIKKNSKVVVLKENEKVLVITSRKLFISTCKSWSKAYKFKTHETLLKYIEKDKSNTINVEILRNEQDLESSYDDIFQSLLLDNKCLVYNKNKKKLEKIVNVSNYDKDNHGLEYKTENDLSILKTVDYNCF